MEKLPLKINRSVLLAFRPDGKRTSATKPLPPAVTDLPKQKSLHIVR